MHRFFQRGQAFGRLSELVRWRQDKAPHVEGSFRAFLLHGETQSESAGASRQGIAADPWTVMVDDLPASCAAIAVGDSLTLLDGSILSVQQLSKDPALGWIIRCTANARGPRT